MNNKMNVKRRFTEEEDRVILSKISENPSNIAQCLRELSVELGRSYYVLEWRWYKVLSKKRENNNPVGTVFMTYGINNVNLNRKVARVNTQQPVKVKRNKWGRILEIIFE